MHDNPQNPAALSADQLWYTRPDWLAGEAEASAQIAVGGLPVYYDVAEFCASLSAAAEFGADRRAAASAPGWVVPGLVPEGVTVLAGPPKVGKSCLALGLALAVANGTEALGCMRVVHGAVLYLALNDTERALCTRVDKALGQARMPGALELVIGQPPVPTESAVARWLERTPDARMVVIDTYARAAGATPPGMTAYDADRAALGRYKALADRYGVAIVLVHHMRKTAPDGVLAEVCGTHGLAGAADATLALTRGGGQRDGVLTVTGHDIEIGEVEYAVDFDPETYAWSLPGGPLAARCLGPHPIDPRIFEAVTAETERAIAKHGLAHSPIYPATSAGQCLAMLVEEVGEVAHALTYDADPVALDSELIQVAAVAAMWLQARARA